jgi:DNA mismatch endonuclease (patch repair protein)
MGDWLTAEQRSRNMSAIRARGTKPEERLYALAREYFPRRRIAQHAELPGRPDLFLPGLRLAVFVDGCFWHSCPKHGHVPLDNRTYWGPKLERNRSRDHEVVVQLRNMSITTVRIWEHELKGAGAAARRKVGLAAHRAASRTHRGMDRR